MSEPELGPDTHRHRPRQVLKKARCTSYIVVELPGKKFRLYRIFKSSQEFSTRPDSKQYTHVCRMSVGYAGRRAERQNPRIVQARPPRRTRPQPKASANFGEGPGRLRLTMGRPKPVHATASAASSLRARAGRIIGGIGSVNKEHRQPELARPSPFDFLFPSPG